MGLLSQCVCCEAWKKKNDRYRKQSSPRTTYLPGNIEKSHFVYSPKLSAREDCVFRPSIQQLAQTFAIENGKKEKATGLDLPLSSYYLDFPQISIKPHPDSPKQRPDSPESRTGSPEPRTGSLVLGTGSPEPRTGSLELGTGSPEPRTGSLAGSPEPRTGSLVLGTGSPEPRTGSLQLGTGSLVLDTGSLVLGTGSPEAINIKVIHVKPALDLWKNDESTGLKDDDNDELDLVKLVPSEVNVGPKGTKLIHVKPVKDSMYLVQETDAEPDSQLTTDLSQVVDCDSNEELEENLRKSSRSRLLENNNRTNNNVSSDISTITLPESALKPQPKPRPDTMFCVTSDNAWRGQSTSIIDIKSNNKKKAKKDKVTYTNIETLVESKDEDEEIKQKKKSKNIFKRFYSRFAQHFR